jgi:hypothetical protein
MQARVECKWYAQSMYRIFAYRKSLVLEYKDITSKQAPKNIRPSSTRNTKTVNLFAVITPKKPPLIYVQAVKVIRRDLLTSILPQSPSNIITPP